MLWFHTWLGIGVGVVLFAVFWAGSLTVFDKEIDQWMKPELRIASQPVESLDALVLPALDSLQPKEKSTVWISPPQDRIPAIRISYKDQEGKSQEAYLDPDSGKPLDLTDSHAGTDFFFHFHFMLNMPGSLGYWVVGISALAMLALVVSGIFIHRNIFRDFFTFRPKKPLRRSTLDFHNLTAVIGLPFHFLLPFTGLFIFAGIYFPWPIGLPYDGNARGLSAETSGYQQMAIEVSDKPGAPIPSVEQLLIKANDIWRTEEGAYTSGADWIGIFNYGNENTYVIVERYFPSRRVSIGPHQISFNPYTQEKLEQFSPRPVHAAMNWVEGLHWIQFDHWPLRWLYFFAGLSGCAMIASGLVFWMQHRIKKGKPDPANVRAVRAMCVSAITGIIIASAGFLIANRLIPKTIAVEGTHRHDLEIWAFFLIWLATLIHAIIRGKHAWRDQYLAIFVTGIGAVILNWVTTGDHLLASAHNSVWSVFTADLVILTCAFIAMFSAKRLLKSESNESSPSSTHTLKAAN